MRCIEILLLLLLLLIGVWELRFLVLSSLGRSAEQRGATASALVWYGAAEGEPLARDLELSRATLSLKQGSLADAEAAVRRYLYRNAQDARAWDLLGQIELKSFRLSNAAMDFRLAFFLGTMNDIGIAYPGRRRKSVITPRLSSSRRAIAPALCRGHQEQYALHRHLDECREARGSRDTRCVSLSERCRHRSVARRRGGVCGSSHSFGILRATKGRPLVSAEHDFLQSGERNQEDIPMYSDSR